MLRVIIDTNVLISGVFFSGGPSLILKAWQSGIIQIVDADDDKFFACAITAIVSVIISGDHHLLDQSGQLGVMVQTPASFIASHRRLKK